jgi:hypothetical protein
MISKHVTPTRKALLLLLLYFYRKHITRLRRSLRRTVHPTVRLSRSYHQYCSYLIYSLPDIRLLSVCGFTDCLPQHHSFSRSCLRRCPVVRVPLTSATGVSQRPCWSFYGHKTVHSWKATAAAFNPSLLEQTRRFAILKQFTNLLPKDYTYLRIIPEHDGRNH